MSYCSRRPRVTDILPGIKLRSQLLGLCSCLSLSIYVTNRSLSNHWVSSLSIKASYHGMNSLLHFPSALACNPLSCHKRLSPRITCGVLFSARLFCRRWKYTSTFLALSSPPSPRKATALLSSISPSIVPAVLEGVGESESRPRRPKRLSVSQSKRPGVIIDEGTF